MNNSIEKELNRWYKRLWETKGSRFIAAKRYERIDRLSAITINIISTYLLAINLLVLIPNRSEILSDNNITFFTISASIIILAISIYLPSRQYRDTAKKFHDCARDINIIYDKICLMKCDLSSVTMSQLSTISDEYNETLKKYDINHDRLDYTIFKCNNKAEYDITYWYIYKPYIYFLSFLRYYSIYILTLICPLFLLLIL